MEFVPAGTQLTTAQRRQRRLFLVLSLAFIAFWVCTVLVMQFGSLLDVDAPNMFHILRDKVWPRLEAKGQATQFIVGAAAIVVFQATLTWWAYWVHPHGRLLLDAEGIEHRPPSLPDVLQAFDAPWRINWRELRRVELAHLRQHQAQAELRWIVLVTADGTRRKLRPFAWEVAGRPDPDAPLLHGGFLALTRRGAQETARFDAHPLVAALAARGFAPGEPELAQMPWWRRPLAVAGTRYDLSESPAMQVGLATAFISAVYGVAELVQDRYRFALPAPEHAFVAVGLIVAGGAFAWFRATRVPLVESLVVALLVGGGFGLAARPLALRVNALSDADGATVVIYTLGPDLRFIAPDPGLPEFQPSGYAYDYWNQFHAGDRYPLALHRGALGFWQIDTAPMHAEVAAFYRFGPKQAVEARAHARRIVPAAGDDDGR